MGELSKKIGEHGEDVIQNILSEIGWGQAQKGIELSNLFKNLYDKKTYGIDFLMTYECPLVDNSIKNILISVKYHKDKFPDSYKSLAKSHLIELSEMMHSFEYSDDKVSASEPLNGNIVEDIGVLIWLCHKETSINLRKELENIRIELPYEKSKIILLDNIQVEFILSAISFIKHIFPGQRVEFYYPNTGQNINPITKSNSGDILPIEFISSPILPIKITENGIITLSIITSEFFNKGNLRRIMGLAQELSTNLPNQVLIGFPDYDVLEHENEYKSVKSEFLNSDFASKIYIANYNNLQFKIK